GARSCRTGRAGPSSSRTSRRPGCPVSGLTGGQLAAELEVSQRTVLRDIEALSAAGIPVYAVRGSLGGFELLDRFRSDLPAAAAPRPPRPARPAAQRAR